MLIVGRRRHGPAAELGLTLMRLARTRAWTLRPRLPASGPAAELSCVLVHSAPDSALPTPEGVCLPSRSVQLALAVCNDWFIVMSLIVSPCGAQPMLNPGSCGKRHRRRTAAGNATRTNYGLRRDDKLRRDGAQSQDKIPRARVPYHCAVVRPQRGGSRVLRAGPLSYAFTFQPSWV